MEKAKGNPTFWKFTFSTRGGASGFPIIDPPQKKRPLGGVNGLSYTQYLANPIVNPCLQPVVCPHALRLFNLVQRYKKLMINRRSKLINKRSLMCMLTYVNAPIVMSVLVFQWSVWTEKRAPMISLVIYWLSVECVRLPCERRRRQPPYWMPAAKPP